MTSDGAITYRCWGSIDNMPVKLFTIKNENNQQVDVSNYGASIVAIRTPDKNGKVDDVVLGFDNIKSYVEGKAYFGATIGRVANRIAGAKFELDGVVINLGENIKNSSLHGGYDGWSTKIWDSEIQNNSLVLTHLSLDASGGYPGTVIATAIFKLNNDGSLIIEMKACTTKATPINLTNHSYFNLAGHGTNSAELYKHSITINADRWTVTDSSRLPTGEIRNVAGTIMDLRKPTILSDVINKVEGGGYDHNFCISENNGNQSEKMIAKVRHPSSGRTLEVYSNQPGVQFYTSNALPENNEAGIIGKEGMSYFKHGALCLETQNYPDAVNHKNFPNSIIRPGEIYHHIVTYKFGVEI